MNQYVLTTRNLSKIYGDKYILENISIDLKPNKIYALTGENGSGKTTLIKIIMGLIPKTTGYIEIFGHSEEKDLKGKRKQVGLVTENQNTYSNMSIKTILKHHRIKKHIYNEEIEDELLGLVGISNMDRHQTNNLSIITKKKLDIAIALLDNPKLLILDDPTKGLNSFEVVEILDLLKKIHKNKKLTILLTSNDLPALYNTATDFIIMHKGKIENIISSKKLNQKFNQLDLISDQIYKSLQNNTKQIVTLDHINKDLNSLATSVNILLKEEEERRNKILKDEKNFKELISNISHDLRTPLSIIKGNLQLIDGSNLTLEQTDKLKTAQKYAKDLELLIESFFQYTYLISDEDKLYIEKLNLTNFIGECIVEFINEFEKKNINVKYNEPSAILINTDKKILKRIIYNIFQNCFDHSNGDIIIELNSEDRITLSIKNPIKKDIKIDINKVFNRFYTSENSKSKTTGLGLSIVKLLISKLDGTISASIYNNIFEIIISLPNK